MKIAHFRDEMNIETGTNISFTLLSDFTEVGRSLMIMIMNNKNSSHFDNFQLNIVLSNKHLFHLSLMISSIAQPVTHIVLLL